jgi:hypothetical protein
LKPVDALEMAAAKIIDGPVFVSVGKGDRVNWKQLSDNAIGEIVKRYAAAAGFDPKMFAGHSLRTGFVTSALEHGADIFKVMHVTRHRRVETLKGYDRRAKAFRNYGGRRVSLRERPQPLGVCEQGRGRCCGHNDPSSSGRWHSGIPPSITCANYCPDGGPARRGARSTCNTRLMAVAGFLPSNR